MNKYFGEPLWDAPMYEYMESTSITKVLGRFCIWCREAIEEGDHGIAGFGNAGEVDGVQHIECHLRAIFGSPAHIEGKCSCYGKVEEDSGMTWREEGRIVVERVQKGEI